MVKSDPDSGPDSGPGRWASDTPTSGHPILAGLLALVSVAVVVGIILGIGTLLGTRVLGFGGGGTDQGATAGASMYLPEPVPTSESAASDSSSTPASGSTSSSAADKPTKEPKPITLNAAPKNVGSFERINLTGTYPTGSGAILQVQRRDGGRWVEFSVTAAVNGDAFATYVQTSRIGENRFRVVDTDSGKASNPVTVTVG